MEKKEFISKVKKTKGKSVLVCINGLYMPIKSIDSYDDYIVLNIRDIRKVD